MRKPNVCILRAAGTNCDYETGFAFSRAQGSVEFIHINSLTRKEKKLEDYDILAIPGGFSYGDDIAAGKILANELKYKLIDDIRRFIREGKLIIGICNGFQVLVKSALLPGSSGLKQEASLVINDSGKFEDRWVYLREQRRENREQRKCVWTKNLPEVIYLPVAHGEGKFITDSNAGLERLRQNGQVVFQYCDEQGNPAGYPYNPNGSQNNIAGICDITGRILGLMPHPERHIEFTQHPRWTSIGDTPAQRNRVRAGVSPIDKDGDGFLIFKNGVEYARKFL